MYAELCLFLSDIMQQKMIRYMLLTLCLLLCHMSIAQISINGAKVFHDRRTNTFLASIPQGQWGKECFVSVIQTDSCLWQNVMVDGQGINHPVRLDLSAPHKRYLVTATIGDSLIAAHLEFTYLPIIHLEGEFGYDDAPGIVTLQQPDGSMEAMTALVRWRGATTNQEFKHKRNYRIKFVDGDGVKQNRRLFSLRSDDDWILDAGQADMFRLRNHIAAELWNDFATKPYYAGKNSDIYTATRGEVVEVFLNDEYRGIYNLCEPMDKKQLKLKEYDSATGEIHGGLWKSVGWSFTTFEEQPPLYDNTQPEWCDYELKYPKTDDLCPSDYSTLYNAIDFVVNATGEEFKEHVGEYIDLPVFYDYILFMNVLDAFDLAGKNLYWAVYDKQQSKRITPVMWDLDSTVGQSFAHEPPPHPDYVSYDSWPMLPTKISIQLFDNDYDSFSSLLAKRYFSLRKDVFSFSSLFERYKSHYDLIKGCGAVQREERLWSGDTDIEGLKLDFEAELSFIRNWLDNRLKHLDIFFSDPASVRGLLRNVPINGRTYTIQGTPALPAQKGIVVSEGKKMLHR